MSAPLRPEDRGALACRISIRDGTVYLDFGTTISWLALPAKAARVLGRGLLEIADELDTRAESSMDGREG